ncbi:hypothetical protein ACLMAL_35505 [Nocardia sp. CWNU-33]|uniref:hypothetical protein n=1 Tax=Nocardia sp. CWNU-33 TaxID=3392117 RepID=UPI00398EFAEB
MNAARSSFSSAFSGVAYVCAVLAAILSTTAFIGLRRTESVKSTSEFETNT